MWCRRMTLKELKSEGFLGGGCEKGLLEIIGRHGDLALGVVQTKLTSHMVGENKLCVCGERGSTVRIRGF